MTIFLCKACGTSYPDAPEPPEGCPICLDERQFVPATGQAWIDRSSLAEGHRNAWQRHEPNLFSVQTVPAFAINQRAFLLRTPEGNVLWDCITLFDRATEELVRGLGGIRAIAISHPHYYTTMQDWASAFDAPVHLHADDRRFCMRPGPTVDFWQGDTLDVLPGVRLVRAGGHFPGGTVLHWTGTTDGGGVLMAGDIVQVTPGARAASFMWSYPNMLPLSAGTVRQVAARLAPWRFERIYGAFIGQDVAGGGSGLVARSAARYIEHLEG